jgi:hypothetical protein
VVIIVLEINVLTDGNGSEPGQPNLGVTKEYHEVLAVVFVCYGFVFGAMSPILTGFAFANKWHGDGGKMVNRQLVLVITAQLALLLIVGVIWSSSYSESAEGYIAVRHGRPRPIHCHTWPCRLGHPRLLLHAEGSALAPAPAARVPHMQCTAGAPRMDHFLT